MGRENRHVAAGHNVDNGDIGTATGYKSEPNAVWEIETLSKGCGPLDMAEGDILGSGW